MDFVKYKESVDFVCDGRFRLKLNNLINFGV
jgi:hypothetical protein